MWPRRGRIVEERHPTIARQAIVSRTGQAGGGYDAEESPNATHCCVAGEGGNLRRPLRPSAWSNPIKRIQHRAV
jgi:hypothetical protein